MAKSPPISRIMEEPLSRISKRGGNLWSLPRSSVRVQGYRGTHSGIVASLDENMYILFYRINCLKVLAPQSSH